METSDQPRVMRWRDLPSEPIFPGICRQRVDTEQVTVVRYTYAPGSVFPAHSHPEEQTIIVLSGEIEFDVAGTPAPVGAGGVLIIPPEMVHGARVSGDYPVETLNVLSPRRSEPMVFTDPAVKPSPPSTSSNSTGRTQLRGRGSATREAFLRFRPDPLRCVCL